MKNLTQLVLFAALVPAAYSQSVLYQFDGDSAGDGLGDFHNRGVSNAGDVNGDGFDDLIVGARLDDNNGTDSGMARVFSGIDGSLLYQWDGDSPDDRFGVVRGAGDVNADGFDDLIVGATRYDNNGVHAGMARVYSGFDGTVLHQWEGDSPGDQFALVSGAGDVNGDGFDDLIVGARLDDNNGTDSGMVRVFSGIDGSLLYQWDGQSTGDEFGFSVSGAGDVNADGFDDVIVGARFEVNGVQVPVGTARVFSGQTGGVLHTIVGNGMVGAGFLGWSVSGAGDVNADGYDDVIVGAPSTGSLGIFTGTARVVSGLDGSTLHEWDGDGQGDWLGAAVSGAGDVNGDGFPDLVVGAPGDANNGHDSGMVRVFSGVDGSVLHEWDGDSPEDWFGGSVGGGGDVNGDGFPDLIVGAPRDDNNGTDSGMARVFSGRDLVASYCGPAAVNSTGYPSVISTMGSIVAADNDLTLHAASLPTDAFGFFLTSQTQDFVMNPAGSQGHLCLGGDIGRYVGPGQIQNSGTSGSLSLLIDLTQHPTPTGLVAVNAGELWNFQAWHRDSVLGFATSNFTDAVSVLFQ